MTTQMMHPPTDRRCQIYDDDASKRCRNTGSHWVSWGCCGCEDTAAEACESVLYSWECDGPCTFGGLDHD